MNSLSLKNFKRNHHYASDSFLDDDYANLFEAFIEIIGRTSPIKK